jgi:hypothetical protein
MSGNGSTLGTSPGLVQGPKARGGAEPKNPRVQQDGQGTVREHCCQRSRPGRLGLGGPAPDQLAGQHEMGWADRTAGQ